MATHSTVLAWRIPGMGKLGGLPSMGSHRVGHDWSDLAAAADSILKSRDLTLLTNSQSYDFPVVMYGCEKSEVAQLCLTLCDPMDTRLLCPWDLLGKSTGVGCHFLIQCRKGKSKSEVAQSCLTLCDRTDSSPPGSAIPGILQARALEWLAIAFSEYAV